MYNKTMQSPFLVKNSSSNSVLKAEVLVGGQGRQAVGWGESIVIVDNVY